MKADPAQVWRKWTPELAGQIPDLFKKMIEEFQPDLIGVNIADVTYNFSKKLLNGINKKYGIPVELAETIRKNQREAYQGLWDEIATIMPDAKNTLEILKSRNKMLSLATTNRIHTVEKFINAFDLHGFFSLILTQEDVTHRKPHPEVYLLAKQRIALSEEEILVVEDSEVGVAAAKAAGLYCAAVPNQHTRSHDFSRADYVCGSLKEILKLV